MTPHDPPDSPQRVVPFRLSRPTPLDHRGTFARTLRTLKPVASDDTEVREHVGRHISDLVNALVQTEEGERLRCYGSFTPPRLVHACTTGELVPFFGSGISIAAGIPSWGGLLERLGIAADYLSDPQVENDPLTQAELLAHRVGADSLQQELRELTKRVKIPTVAHRLLALARLPAYITTNYDSLFEEAWESEWGEKITVVKNDIDVLELKLDAITELPFSFTTADGEERRPSILIKLHGDAASESNHLILARSDYRRHYRSNQRLFTLIQRLMLSGVTLFVGFSHRDPEASRLVEDVVYEYEVRRGQRPPTLYSLQFDMRQRTPEVFAARGIVALRPPPIIAAITVAEARSAAVAVQLAELIVAADGTDHARVDIYEDIQAATAALAADVDRSLDLLAGAKGEVESALNAQKPVEQLLTTLVEQLKSTAGQGVYVTLSNGDIAGLAVPKGLLAAKRNARNNFEDRPYFRQAKTFRTQFVSDVMPSVYNGHGTVFLCVPLGTTHSFRGLLFAACQPGAWGLPVQLRDELSVRGVELVLVDSNGIALVPSLADLKPFDSLTAPEGETPGCNIGFSFVSLRDYSQRDLHVAHVTQNIVPVGVDDDIHDVSPELRLFSMVASVPKTRWKLALSRYVPSAAKAV
jgi:hypothetical protein